MCDVVSFAMAVASLLWCIWWRGRNVSTDVKVCSRECAMFSLQATKSHDRMSWLCFSLSALYTLLIMQPFNHISTVRNERKGNLTAYSTSSALKALRHGSHSFRCKLHYACLSFVNAHQMAPPMTKAAYIQVTAYYSFIDPERLSWPGWLTYSGWSTHISGHPSATGKVRRPKTDVLPLCHATNQQWSVLFFSNSWSEGWSHRGPFISVLWLTLPQGVLSTSWCCPSRPCVVFLACVHLTLFLALSLCPGNSLVSSWCDHSMLVSLLQQSSCHQHSEGLWPLTVQFVVHHEIHRGSLSSTRMLNKSGESTLPCRTSFLVRNHSADYLLSIRGRDLHFALQSWGSALIVKIIFGLIPNL